MNNDEAFFISKMERLGLNFLQRKDLATAIDSIKEDVSMLPTNLAQVAQHIRIINDLLTNKFWQEANLTKIDDTKETLAPIMKYKMPRPSLMIELGLDDIIESRRWVILRKDNQKVYIEEYRKRVEAKILELAEKHPAIIKLKMLKRLALMIYLTLNLHSARN